MSDNKPKTLGEKIAGLSTSKKILLSILVILIVFTPLGLLDSAAAYGEWDPSWYKKHLGFVPQGLVQWSQKLQFPHLLPGYGLPSGQHPVIGYYISAVVGAILIFVVMFILAKIFSNKKAS